MWANRRPTLWSKVLLQKLVGSQLVNKFHILWVLKSHNSVHYRLLLIRILSHISPDHAMAFQSTFFKIQVNFTLLLIRGSDTKNVAFSVGKNEQESKKKGDDNFFWTSSKFLQNTGTYIQNYEVSHPARPFPPYLPQWKSQSHKQSYQSPCFVLSSICQC